MARRAVVGMQFFADFSGVEKALGAAWGAIDALEDKQYQDDVIRVAFAEANDIFNMEAAAYAAAGGNIKHMFEWGTIGINRGRTNMRPQPLSDRARLWQPVIEGQGLRKQFDFTFQPSIAFVPKPTAGKTGMDPEVIASMRDHVFWNKALVMESGMEVTIALKEAEFLLFPFYKGHVPPHARSNDIARGYTLNRGPVSLTPGAHSAGQFNAFWVQFWENQGNDILNASVQRQIEQDLASQIPLSTPARMPHRVIPGSVTKAVDAERKRVERNARRRAAYRRKKEEANNG